MSVQPFFSSSLFFLFFWRYCQDADLTLSPPGDPLTVLGKFSIVAMGNQVAVQTDKIWAVGVSSYISNGTYPEGSVIPIVVSFSVEVSTC